MTQICLIRHGETEWDRIGRIQGVTDIPLNEFGRKQAHDCGTFLVENLVTSQDFKYDVLLTSPLKRAKETAEIINEYLQLPFIELPDLKERSFGDAEGLLRKDREKLYPTHQYPNMEDREAFQNRVMGAIDQIHQLYRNQKVIAVAHGAVINQILSILSEGEIGSGKTKIANTSLNNIFLREENWHIRNYNQVGHIVHQG